MSRTFCGVFLLVLGSLLVAPRHGRGATIQLTQIPVGKVIAINGQKFVKIGNDIMKGSRFAALEKVVFLPPNTQATTDCPRSRIIGTMQTWNDCAALAIPAQTAYTDIGCLVDERDGKPYEVRKFADGKCWMADNLAYGGTTDSCAAKTTFNGMANLSGAAWGFGDCRSNPGDTYGYLYSWQAAVQSATAYYGNSNQPTQPTQGICPLGWHIPLGGTSGELVVLDVANGDLGTNHSNCTTATCNFFRPSHSFKGVYAGFSKEYGSLSSQGSHFGLWYSTVAGLYSGYASNIHSGLTYLYNDVGKYNGLSVRCIKD